MDIKEITNIIFKKFYESGLKIYLDFSIDETAENAVQIQLTIKPLYFDDFAIFYGTKDKKINYSSIIISDDINKEKLNQLFNKDKGIFSKLICSEKHMKYHLYGEMKLNEFDTKFIDEIIRYLKEKHELTDYLMKHHKKEYEEPAIIIYEVN